MPKQLSQVVVGQESKKSIHPIITLTLNDNDISSDLVTWDIQSDKSFGSMTATFTLANATGKYSSNGSSPVSIGDIVQLKESYNDDTDEWGRFYGIVDNRSVIKNYNTSNITLTCLDYISVLQHLEINLVVEGTKVFISNELLDPIYLPEPNDNIAQLFNFNNSSIADLPPANIVISNKAGTLDEPQFDGYEIIKSSGQLKLGAVLNAKDNYDIKASYHFYIEGLYIEDVIEQLLTLPDGYGGYLFKNTTKSSLLTNNLQDDFRNINGSSAIDVLTPNIQSANVVISHKVTDDYTATATSIVLDSLDGIPSTGEAKINGNVIEWTSSNASTKTLSGVTGLKITPINSIFKYEKTYPAGQVWYFTYSNLVTDLTSSDFTLPTGKTILYLDKRFGRIILSSTVSVSSSDVKLNSNYTFKTLQATGISINGISITSKEVNNRFEGLEEIRKNLPPNYLINTVGDNKIWGRYLRQSPVADYTLNLVTELNYIEDEELYTRVKLYGDNNNPLNVVLGEDASFLSTGDNYKAIASNLQLFNIGSIDVDPQPNVVSPEFYRQVYLIYNRPSNYLRVRQPIDDKYIYGNPNFNNGGILIQEIVPRVYINGIQISGDLQTLIQKPATVHITTTLFTKTGCHGLSFTPYFKQKSIFIYQVYTGYTSLHPFSSVYFYSATGVLIKELSPLSAEFNYALGIWSVPGTEKNELIELISTCTFSVVYHLSDLEIDYENTLFKISKRLIPNPENALITAYFQYWTAFTAVEEIGNILDGDNSTQAQTIFYYPPPTGYTYAILDLGKLTRVQVLDITGGFFEPDELRKFDTEITFSLQSSTDNVTYYNVSAATTNIKLSSGEGVSFGQEELPEGFKTRYFKIILEEVKPIEYHDGRWVVAFSSFAVYSDIVLEEECKLIPTCTITQTESDPITTIEVNHTTNFDNGSTETPATAYLGNVAFTYTGKTDESFTGTIVPSTGTVNKDNIITQKVEDPNSIVDTLQILPSLGDRVFIDNRTTNGYLYSQENLQFLAKAFLHEFIKNNNKVNVKVIYSPYLQVGNTVRLIDSSSGVDANFFIDSISENNGNYDLVIARYESD